MKTTLITIMTQLMDFTLSETFMDMLLHFCIFMLFNWFITDRLYYSKSHRSDFYFTFILSSMAVFFIVFFMIFVLEDMKAKTSIGIGIGLFGIFSIMRYRTDSIHVREMTYMFVIIALAVVNAIATSVSIAELLLTNVLFVVAIYLVEKVLRQYPVKLVQYDRIELITPERRGELRDDLHKRLGVEIVDVQVGAVDFLRDMAMLKVTYKDNEKSDADVNGKIKLRNDDLAEIN